MGFSAMKDAGHPLKNILTELSSGTDPLIDPSVLAVIEAWRKVVPPSLRPALCLEGLREGVLHLLVSHPAAAQQLQFQKEVLVEKMNRLLNKPLVRGIRVKVGSFPPHP
jgi:hypothetical protein